MAFPVLSTYRLQLRGAAGANQVANAQTALIQSVGGLGSSAITHVLQS